MFKYILFLIMVIFQITIIYCQDKDKSDSTFLKVKLKDGSIIECKQVKKVGDTILLEINNADQIKVATKEISNIERIVISRKEKTVFYDFGIRFDYNLHLFINNQGHFNFSEVISKSGFLLNGFFINNTLRFKDLMGIRLSLGGQFGTDGFNGFDLNTYLLREINSNYFYFLAFNVHKNIVGARGGDILLSFYQIGFGINMKTGKYYDFSIDAGIYKELVEYEDFSGKYKWVMKLGWNVNF